MKRFTSESGKAQKSVERFITEIGKDQIGVEQFAYSVIMQRVYEFTKGTGLRPATALARNIVMQSSRSVGLKKRCLVVVKRDVSSVFDNIMLTINIIFEKREKRKSYPRKGELAQQALTKNEY